VRGPAGPGLEEPINFYILAIIENHVVIAALAALAQETRLDVFRLLVRTGREGLPAGRIAERLGVVAATLSFHLKELKGAGVVRCERDGRSRIYTPDFAAIGELVAYLTENCCAGDGG
jgi:ArsR family transcriptional regulator